MKKRKAMTTEKARFVRTEGHKDALEFALSLADERGQVLGLDDVSVLEDEDALDGVLQFAHVSGP